MLQKGKAPERGCSDAANVPLGRGLGFPGRPVDEASKGAVEVPS